MMNISVRCKSAVLAVTLLLTGQAGAFVSLEGMWAAVPVMPNIFVPTAKQVAVAAFIVGWIRLQSKGSSFDYQSEDWDNDIKDLVAAYNIFDAESRAVIKAFIDKSIVGRKLHIVDIATRTLQEDGSVVTMKDKKLKKSPFGLIGNFDAYVIGMIEKIGKIQLDYEKASIFYGTWSDTMVAAMKKAEK